MFVRAILSSLLLIGLATSGCAQRQLTSTCFDGWTVDEVGASKVINPTAYQRSDILSAIDAGAAATCFHSLARGDIVVVFENDSFVTVRKSAGGYEVIERGKVMSAD